MSTLACESESRSLIQFAILWMKLVYVDECVRERGFGESTFDVLNLSSVGTEPLLVYQRVGRLCRDGTDTPYTQYKTKHSKSLQKNNIKLL